MELLPPTTGDGHWLAADRYGAAQIRFVGRGPRRDRLAVLAAVGAGGLELAWCRQVHSDRSLEAAPGECGEADALMTDRPGLALAVATADCVPIVIVRRDRLAVIHAGWRGIAASIVLKTLERLGGSGSPIAWLGPAIGPCCYEVGSEVAEAVVSVSGSQAVAVDAAERRSGKPHLDLQRAVAGQLEASGVAEIRRLDVCTSCQAEALSSYRRDGARAGRNYTFAWLDE